ncbi:MAG: 50S ribosomal protein L4 [Caulobacterales bacterium]
MKLDVVTLDATKSGDIDLPEDIFGLEPRKDILERVVRWQLAKRQAGTHKVKRRGEINRSHSKIYKQKGTGNARHGSANAPIFRGGGRAHGPEVRSHAHDLPKKVRALGLKFALSSKAGSKDLIIIDDAKLNDPKTAALLVSLGKLGLTNALVIGGETLDANFEKASRNIPNFDVLPAQGLNVYDILRRKKLVLTKAAVEAIKGRFEKTPAEAAA